jgi:mono/diheme cytochrome c family protein
LSFYSTGALAANSLFRRWFIVPRTKAACHGTDGKGGGPAGGALKNAPADLSVRSKNNSGKYPAPEVTSAIRGTADLPAHGSKEMPMWGPLFWILSNRHESEVQQRVANLTQYIETLQAK